MPAALTLELTESDPINACFLAQGLLGQGDVKGAVAHIRRATARFPGSGLAWNDRSHLMLLVRRPKEALLAARRAVKLIGERSAQPWAHLGDALADLGRVEEALEAWERALELGNHPDRATVQAKLERAARRLDALERRAADEGRWRGYHHPEKDRVWAVRLEGAGHTVREGQVGEKGRKVVRRFNSARAARHDARRRIAEKTRRGFVPVEARSDAAPAARPRERPAPRSAPRTAERHAPRGERRARSPRARERRLAAR